MHKNTSRVVSQNGSYLILEEVVFHQPSIEREVHEEWVISYFMQHINGGPSIRIDTVGGESFPRTHFSWPVEGVVEWVRDWIISSRDSAILGKTAVRQAKKIQFDFKHPEKSQILFSRPENIPSNNFNYSSCGYTFLFDLDKNVLFVWP